jgi:ATPase subunit of ABC transporter with duplicated ATPase domains
MSIFTAENISQSFGGRQILENVSFRLLNGEHVGLIGANGEGKSTFLNIITGKLTPDEGRIEWCNRITTGYLDQHTVLQKGRTIREVLQDAFQHMFDLEQEMLRIYDAMGDAGPEAMEKMLEDVGDIQGILEHSGFYSIDSRIVSFANGLGLGDIGLDRDVSELSGGQRSKVLLAKLLLENPMILILDEPTNFLDENHIEWLTNFLIHYENSFILVSHDIPFLNKVVNVIYHAENAKITRYTGSYEQFREMYELRKVQNQQAYEKQQKEIDRLEDFIARNKARAATATLAKSRQKKLDGMEIIEQARRKVKPTFKFREARTPGKVLFDAKDLVLGYDAPLTRPVSVVLERGQKVAVRGVNGLGKSTLLKTLMGLIPPFSGEVRHDAFLIPGYFEQESAGGNSRTALEEIWEDFPGLSNGEVRAALARCGLTSEHIQSQMLVLSGGENAKVRLCKLMLRDVNCLVLDEPTNHLDSDAKEELQKALREFRGTVLLVSHEPEFYRDWISDVWNVEDWTNKLL